MAQARGGRPRPLSGVMSGTPGASPVHRSSREMSLTCVPDRRNYFPRWRRSGSEFFGEGNDVLSIFVKNNGKKN